MSSRTRKSSGGPGRMLAIFLIANMPAIGALVWIGVARARGDIVMDEVPSGTQETLIVLAGASVALLLVASLSLPTAHRAVRALRSFLGSRLAIVLGRDPGSRSGALLAIPILAPVYLVAWLVRSILIAMSLALIVIVIAFMVRLFRPEFLEGAIREVLAWRPAKLW